MYTSMPWVAGFLLCYGAVVSDGHVVGAGIKRTNYLSPAHLSYDSLSPDNRTLCPETPENKPPERVDTTAHLAMLRTEMATAHTTAGQQDLSAYIVMYGDEHMSGGVEYDMRLEYISGFSGSNGYAIVFKDKAALWTDGRYFTQGDLQMDCNWIIMKMETTGYPTGPEYLVDQLPSGTIVGVDPKLIGISTWQEYEAQLEKAGVSLMQVSDELIDNIWSTNDGRVPKPDNDIYEHTMDFAGKSWQDKVTELRSEMADMADVLMITALDETAWLFNLRGSDYPTSPLFYSYAMLMQDEVRLYLTNHQQKISDVLDHLNTGANGICSGDTSLCVNVRAYADVTTDLEQLGLSKSVSLTPSSSYAIYSSAGDQRRTDLSPMQLMKSVKNAVERRRYYECQVRDSAALVQFMAILEPSIKAGDTWTELTTAQKLTDIRSADPSYRMNSFDYISAVGENAAVIHYRATNASDTALTTQDVYLLDSGGNYLDGTTDVTRTFHFGTPKAIEIEAYTRVLVGVIELATTVWPEGLLGSQIDARTRAYLWENGWDYNHGTGHGIAYFINVHEGPGRISMGYNPNHSPLYAGMFFSDEPGYYEVGEYGIRLETIVGIEEADTPNHFDDQRFLTFHAATLVPFEPHLIDYRMLNQKHRQWLNAYNARCVAETGALLQDRGNTAAYEWLAARTAHIPDVPEWTSITSGASASAPLACTLLVSVVAAAVSAAAGAGADGVAM